MVTLEWKLQNAVKDALNGENSAKNAGFIGNIRRNARNTLKNCLSINNIYK